MFKYLKIFEYWKKTNYLNQSIEEDKEDQVDNLSNNSDREQKLKIR